MAPESRLNNVILYPFSNKRLCSRPPSFRYLWHAPCDTIRVLISQGANGAPITFTGAGTNNIGNTISATAKFDYSTPGVLTLTLTNTYATALHVGGAAVLTGL